MDKIINVKELMRKWMTEYWGERCPDFCEECPCCKAWKYFDYIFEFYEDLDGINIRDILDNVDIEKNIN